MAGTKAPPNPTGTTTPQLLDEADKALVLGYYEQIEKADAIAAEIALEARVRWANAVRQVGIAATARFFGVTTQAIWKKVDAIEKAAEKRTGAS